MYSTKVTFKGGTKGKFQSIATPVPDYSTMKIKYRIQIIRLDYSSLTIITLEEVYNVAEEKVKHLCKELVQKWKKELIPEIPGDS